uniref:Uncharacterized protein n=1 Tax=Glossina brevipalpis TaxID=37001 RepID=A0A1A9WLS9_9MUSC
MLIEVLFGLVAVAKILLRIAIAIKGILSREVTLVLVYNSIRNLSRNKVAILLESKLAASVVLMKVTICLIVALIEVAVLLAQWIFNVFVIAVVSLSETNRIATKSSSNDTRAEVDCLRVGELMCKTLNNKAYDERAFKDALNYMFLVHNCKR